MNEKEFETESVSKVFLKLVIPGICSMIFSSIAMIIDGIFVGSYIGSEALAAVNIIMPIFIIIFALSDMVAVGSSVKVSMALGKEKYEEAKSIFSASILVVLIIGLVLSFMGIFFTKNIINFYIKDASLAAQAYEYTMPFIKMMPFVLIFYMTDNYLRICGKANLSMYINILTTVINIFLDWYFIAHLHLSIKASAYATAISMTLGAVFSVLPFILNKVTLRFSRPKMSLKVLSEIIYNGSSVFFGNIAGSIISIIVNALLVSFGGANAVSALGIVIYIDSILRAVLFGMSDSIQPLISYNAGRGNKKVIYNTFKLSSVAAIIFSIIAMLILMIFKEPLILMFINAGETEVIEMTRTAIDLFVPSYLFSWFTILVGSLFTNLDMPRESFIIMICNSLIFPLIILFLSYEVLGLYGVFATETMTEILTFILCLALIIKLYKNTKESI